MGKNLYRYALVLLALLLAGGPVVVSASRSDLELHLRELRRRQFIVDNFFHHQRAVWEDKNRFKVLWTTRRAGKTTTALIDWLLTALDHPHSHSLFLGHTRKSAKRNAWGPLKAFCRKFGIKARFNEGDLVCTLPNGATLELFGVDRPGLAERLHGAKLIRVYIDEAALFSIDLTRLVRGAVMDAVSDLQGEIWLMSTPGYIPRGLFFELTRCFNWREIFSGRRPEPTDLAPFASRWSVHRWTTAENPHMAQIFAQEIADELAANPDAENDPEFKRNKRGAWVFLEGEQVYLFDAELNTFPYPRWTAKPGDHYVLALDFGWDDRQAFSFNVWRDDSPILVEIESVRYQRQMMDALYGKVKEYMDAWPGDFTLLGDPGSKQYFEEFRLRYEIPLIQAEKSSKFEWISIYNTALRAGEIQIVNPGSSPHVREMMDLTWDIKLNGTKQETRGQDNDACDASLYAFRHARHYLRGEDTQQRGPLTAEEIDAIAEAEQIAWEEEQEGENHGPPWLDPTNYK